MRSFSWKKNWGTTLPGGRVNREGGCCNRFSFKKTLILHFEKYLHTMMLKLTEHVGITIFLLYKQKNPVKFWYSELLYWNFEFSPILRKISQFSGPACFYDVITTIIWGCAAVMTPFMTSWPIVLILVCMSREGPYLPIDTKINFIGGSVWKI